MTGTELAALAKQAMQHAYAPYTGKTAGAALLCASGAVYTGCTVENEALTPSLTAEQAAFAAAVTAGERSFSAIAVTGGPYGNTDEPLIPSGTALDTMREFCDPDAFLILLSFRDTYEEYTLSDFRP